MGSPEARPRAGASLRARLLALVLGAVALGWGATAWFTYLDARREIGAMLDAQLVQSARLLSAQAGDEPEELELDDHEARDKHRFGKELAVQVWADGKLVLRSSGAPPQRLAARDEGFSDSVIDGRSWRVYSRRGHHGVLVQVAQPAQVRERLAGDVAAHLLHPVLIAAPALALLIWLAVGRGLAPLGRVAAEVARRDPQSLAPLDAAGVPREVRPLADALNGLFARLGEAFEKGRRFTADAAHELRTPLAALRTQAQVALSSTDDRERRAALEKVLQGVDRATRLVEQLLTLARLDHGDAGRLRQGVDLRAVAHECVAELAPRALARNVELGLAEGAPLEVAGDATLLAVLVRNLVDNAVRYTPGGGAVLVAVLRESASVVFEVIDTGPGIPAAERARVLERFYRVLGSEASGSGLGLSIAARICDLHGARLELVDGPRGRGLRARVTFPAPAAG